MANRVGGDPEGAKKVRRGAEMRCAVSRDGIPTAHDPTEVEGKESQPLQRWEYVKRCQVLSVLWQAGNGGTVGRARMVEWQTPGT